MGIEVVRMLEPVRANPFALRYHALMSGPNQTADNAFAAWEHVNCVRRRRSPRTRRRET